MTLAPKTTRFGLAVCLALASLIACDNDKEFDCFVPGSATPQRINAKDQATAVSQCNQRYSTQLCSCERVGG
jgi:hypothetical protein